MAKLTPEELYALVWDRPMTKLAKEFGLYDVALHNICRKHDVPTPPAGYWAKKAHGKPVDKTPLPNRSRADGRYHIIIHEGAGSAESEAAADARPKYTMHSATSLSARSANPKILFFSGPSCDCRKPRPSNPVLCGSKGRT